MSATATDPKVMEIGADIVKMVNNQEYMQAIDKHYSDHIVSIEAGGGEEMPREMKGIEAVRGKSEWWIGAHEVHSSKAEGPFPNGDQFAVIYDLDVTPKEGPMAGNRMQMREVGVYTVKDDKISREQFFYSMG